MVDLGALVETVTRGLVNHPEEVSVTLRGENPVEIDLQVNPADIGRVIGRHGATVTALRQLVRAFAAKDNCRAELNIVE